MSEDNVFNPTSAETDSEKSLRDDSVENDVNDVPENDSDVVVSDGQVSPFAPVGENDEPPHVNEDGALVDAAGNKVFTTVEESVKDGSMVLDSKGRMPGIYLDDLEREANEERERRYNDAFGKAEAGVHSVVERQVNVSNSPLPPITVPVKQETPLVDDVQPRDQPVTSDASENLDRV